MGIGIARILISFTVCAQLLALKLLILRKDLFMEAEVKLLVITARLSLEKPLPLKEFTSKTPWVLLD